MNSEPDFQCSRCGCDMYVFPNDRDWEPSRESYRICFLKVDEPTCGECVVATLAERRIITGVIQGGKE